ncbi:MAG: GDSL-type esterase/lipase family protein [Methanothrix sp.]|nr:GDSL-type esterase/lipase family protein [Methanothrix sp.]
MLRYVFACIVLALIVLCAGAEEQTASEVPDSASDTEFYIPLENAQNNDVFNVVVIGDSVAWGTGLNKNEKYSYLVADWLKTQLNRPVHVKILAHTGATIDRVPCDSTSPTDYPPELSSGRPTLMEQTDMISNPKEVDLILVSGGANDVNLDKLLMLDYGSAINEIGVDCSKFTITIGSTVDDIRKRSKDIKTPMSRLLNKLLDECPNSKIIVTGYYSGVSQKSEGLTEAVAALVPISQNPITKGYQKLDEKAQKDQLVIKSTLFHRVSGDSLEEATKEANDNIGTNRVAFARIFFPPEKCYGTDQSWLWKIDNSNEQVKTNDHMFTTRVALLKKLDKYCECGPCANLESTPLTLSIRPINNENAGSTLPISSGIDCSKYLRDKLDAVGHPNVDGAKNYSESIIREIGAAWPTWLYPVVQAFDVSSRSLTSGESLEITYTVSDSGSGLKQVELWRKDEQSDWQEIKPPNTLAGENGPISGSFTDSPSAPGKYWYGVHVVDNAGNWNDENNSNTNKQPSSYGPIEVEMTRFDSLQEGTKQGAIITPLTMDIQSAFVMSVAFSPDGRTLASGSSDSNVTLWDTATGTKIRTLRGYYIYVRSVAFSPDGRTLASGDDEGNVTFWDTATGTKIRTLHRYDDSVSSVAFSPDGRTLASGDDEGNVTLWDTATGTVIRTLYTGAVNSVAFSPDGHTLASGSTTTNLWDTATGTVIRTLQGDYGSVSSVAFSPDGRTLASGLGPHATGSSRQTVTLCDTATGKKIQTLYTGAVYSVAFSPDGRTLASGCYSNTVKLWDIATGTEIRTLNGPRDSVRSVAFSPDGRTLASGNNDGSIWLWKVA